MSDKVVKTEYEDRVVYTLDGKYHRKDGPALEFIRGPISGSRYWYLYGVRHREDGPAIDWGDGNKQYWVNGEYLDFITNDQALIYYIKYGFLK